MKLFKISGNSSKLELRLEHPIHLEGNYSLGLSGFYSDNYILNFTENAPYCISFTHNNLTKYYGFNKGFYTFDEIEKYFKKFLLEFKQSDKSLTFNENELEFKKVLNKIQIKSPVKMLLKAIVLDLLGFDELQANIEPNKIYLGNKIPKFRPFDVIEIHCNIIESSLENNKENSHLHRESEILYSFFPNVAFGSKISEKPNEIDYIPLKKLNKIQTIIISIQDNEGNLLNTENSKNIVYLRLKKDI